MIEIKSPSTPSPRDRGTIGTGGRTAFVGDAPCDDGRAAARPEPRGPRITHLSRLAGPPTSTAPLTGSEQ